MPDIEKVIKGLERCAIIGDWDCNKCPYGNANTPISECQRKMLTDAVSMLKEKRDAVLVVRCRDCVWWNKTNENNKHMCILEESLTCSYDFCSHGEILEIEEAENDGNA